MMVISYTLHDQSFRAPSWFTGCFMLNRGSMVDWMLARMKMYQDRVSECVWIIPGTINPDR